MTSKATIHSSSSSVGGVACNRDHSFLAAPSALLDDQGSDDDDEGLALMHSGQVHGR